MPLLQVNIFSQYRDNRAWLQLENSANSNWFSPKNVLLSQHLGLIRDGSYSNHKNIAAECCCDSTKLHEAFDKAP